MIMTLAWMQWMSPWWALALPVAVGLPLLIHFRGRRVTTQLDFPAARFVEQAAVLYRRWRRPRNGLMLAWRIILLSAVVIAMMQPVWASRSEHGGADRGLLAVLILDRSASMTRTDSGSTLWDQAQQRAVDAIRSLDPSRDLVSVILLDAHPSALLPLPSANFGQVIRLIEQTPPTHERGDLDAAFRLAALPAPETSDRPNRQRRTPQVHLFSDMQATQKIAGAATQGLDIKLHMIGRDPGNLAVSGPMVTPDRPIVGQPVTVSVDVANYSPPSDPPRDVDLVLHYEDRSWTQRVRLGPRQVQTVGFSVTASKPGRSWATLGLAGLSEPFEADNQTGLIIDARETRPVALVTGGRIDDPQSPAFFVARALVPDEDTTNGFQLSNNGDQDRLYPWVSRQTGVSLAIWPSVLFEERLASHASTKPQTVLIIGADHWTSPALAALNRYLEEGGCVVWVMDGQPSVSALTGLLHEAMGRIPGAVAGVRHWRWQQQADQTIHWGRFDDPILKIFEGPSRANLLRLRFSAAMRWGDVTGGSEARVSGGFEPVLVFGDGSPALATRWVGAGRLAVFAADWSPGHGDLVKGPLFVPLVHQLMRGLTPTPALPSTVHPGYQPVVDLAPSAADQQIRCHGPDGQPVEWSYVGSDAPRLRFAPLPLPGTYSVIDPDRQTLLGGAYVQIDPDESDLRAVTPALGAQPGTEGRSAPSPDVGDPPVNLRPVSTALWPYGVLVALAFAVLEPVLGIITNTDPTRRVRVVPHV